MINLKRGFTLIEVLIYSSLLAFFISAIFIFLNSILGSSDRIGERNELVANQDLILRKMHWLLFNQTASIKEPVAGSSSTLIKVKGLDSKTYTLDLNSGQIVFSEVGGALTPITNNHVDVTKFVVDHFSNGQSNSTFKISLVLQSKSAPTVIASSTFFYDFSQFRYTEAEE